MSRLADKQKKGFLIGGISAVVLIAVAVIVLVAFSKHNSSPIGNDPTPTADVSVDIATPDPNDETAKQQEELAAILSRTTMLEGVSIDGVNVGGMTKEDAKAAVQAAIDKTTANAAVTLQVSGLPADGENPPASEYNISGSDVSLTSDLDAVIEEAFALARTDEGYDAVMALVNDIAANGRSFDVTLSISEEAAVNYVTSLAALIDKAATDATISVDKDNHSIQYLEGNDGYALDREALVAALVAADFSAGDTLTAAVTSVASTVSVDDLKQLYGLRASYKTKVSGSSNRKYNVNKGCNIINGTVLKPGETFSANATLGTRTKANGWKDAPAYVAGSHEDQPGGGVCQLSSTLYNATVLADLEIVSRTNHSMPVGYVPKGRDATINSVGNLIDFKFKNNTQGNIIIICYYVSNYLTMEIYGLPFSTNEYDKIDIRVEKVSTTKITTTYEDDPTLPAGYEEETYEGCTGYIYKSYKQYYKDGKMVKEEDLSTSTYRMYPRVILRGTGATVSPSATAETTSPVSTPAPTSDAPTAPPYQTTEPITTPAP